MDQWKNREMVDNSFNTEGMKKSKKLREIIGGNTIANNRVKV